jgi:tRNA (guanine10-N2)-methyltransferase
LVYLEGETLDDSAVKLILSRSIFIRYAIEIWGQGCSWEACCMDIVSKTIPYQDPTQTYRIEFDAFAKKLPMTRRQFIIESLTCINFVGTVNLKKPEVQYYAIEMYDVDCITELPQLVIFGRCVGEAQRSLLHHYSLKKRALISNTSMDPELAFAMANQALVNPGSCVLDPFVGSGSLLISCAHFVFGGQILMVWSYAGLGNRPKQPIEKNGGRPTKT